jgi:thiamine-phosphate pyrophosphorylase
MRIAPRLIVFTDTSRASPELMLSRFAALARAARAGSMLFTLRDYALSGQARLALGARLRALAEASQQAFGFADRADFTRYLAAPALHLPESGLSEQDARRYLGPHVFLSRACHDPEHVRESRADAVLLSPIFAPRKGRAALGLRALEQVCAMRSASGAGPAVYALGAIDANNASACLAAGAAGVAVIGAALEPDPALLLEALKISRT